MKIAIFGAGENGLHFLKGVLGFAYVYSFYETLQLYPEIIKGYVNKSHG
ncbi:MAG: hypothetical protein HOK52_00960 [Candidatus Marinimicrobia bacterium]|jgi:hypothetical protein|nr:hypothetical protein [Candidatus Neomarinimicrobiota bacterium]